MSSKSWQSGHFHAMLEGWSSIVVNLLLFIFKFWVGYVTRSVAVMADAWHTLSDSLSSVVVVAGVIVARRPADSRHPFGHGRAQPVAALIIGIMLGIVALEFAIQAIQKLRSGTAAEYTAAAYWAMIITMVVKEAMAQYSFWAGKKFRLEVLRADAWHHRSDAISSLLILLAIIFGHNWWWIDGAMGLIVSGMLAMAAWDIAGHAIDPLLGQAPDRQTLRRINAICHECCGPRVKTHHYHLHEYGDHREITFHLKLDGNISLQEAHNYTGRIEAAILREMSIYATIHMEPLPHHRLGAAVTD